MERVVEDRVLPTGGLVLVCAAQRQCIDLSGVGDRD